MGLVQKPEDQPEDPSAPVEAECKRVIGYMLWGTGCLISLIFSGVIAYRLSRANGGIVLSLLQKFDFSQLLSLFLALFSIVLSAMFYFYATDTSNKFYDRTFKHTRALFETLGRIEERFGEMLKNIHEDTSETRQGLAQSKGGVKTVEAPTTVETPNPAQAPAQDVPDAQ
jgi:hypothetical protein